MTQIDETDNDMDFHETMGETEGLSDAPFEGPQSNNLLVYITRCNVSETNIPRVKVQVLQRVSGGVHESSYQLYGDHRLEKSQNDMLFGTEGGASDGSQVETVSETEGQQLLELVNSLQTARQTL